VDLLKALIRFAGVFSVTLSGSLFAQSDAKFAGIATLGHSEDAPIEFPLTTKLLDEKHQNGASFLEYELNTLLVDSVNEFESTNNIESTVASALVVAWENSVWRELPSMGVNRLVTDVYAQAIYFDNASKRLLQAFPIANQHTLLADGTESENVKLQAVKALLLGDEDIHKDKSIFGQFVNLAADQAQSSRDFNVGVASVDLSKNVVRGIVEIGLEETVVNSLVGMSFGRFLSDSCKISLVPFYKDQTIGRKIPIRFDGGREFNLELPPLDVAVDLNLIDYQVKMLKETKTEIGYGFAAYFNISIYQPHLDKPKGVYFEDTFRLPVIATFAKSTGDYDPRQWFVEAVLGLSEGLAASLCDSNMGWLNKNVYKKKGTKKPLTPLKEKELKRVVQQLKQARIYPK